MSSRMRRPDTALLNISRGDWLLVRKHLTAGEHRAMCRSWMKPGVTNSDQIDPINVGWGKIVAYLLDWSFTDADDKPIVIRDKSPKEIGAAIDNLPPDDFKEVLDAIEAHDDAMQAERAAEKNAQAGESASSPISSLPNTLGGATTTLTTSTLMSTT